MGRLACYPDRHEWGCQMSGECLYEPKGFAATENGIKTLSGTHCPIDVSVPGVRNGVLLQTVTYEITHSTEHHSIPHEHSLAFRAK